VFSPSEDAICRPFLSSISRRSDPSSCAMTIASDSRIPDLSRIRQRARGLLAQSPQPTCRRFYVQDRRTFERRYKLVTGATGGMVTGRTGFGVDQAGQYVSGSEAVRCWKQESRAA
jgi:hypothetical protein